MSRSKDCSDAIDAWAVIEKRGRKLVLFSAKVPDYYWTRKLAQGKIGQDFLHVEIVAKHRRLKKP